MSNFTDELIVKKLKTGMWEVQRDFIYYIGEENSSEAVLVPNGFQTDFASVPRIFWNILPPDGKYTQAAVLHDFLYYTKMFDRKKCDDIFLEAMIVLNVPIWKRRIMWRAVRMFGWIPWSKK